LILTGNITATTTNEDQVNINGTQASTINGNIGTVGTVFNLVKVAANASTLMNGNIYATTTQFQGNNTLTLASNSIVSGDITTTAPNQGILAFNGNFSSNGLIGTGVNYLNTINIQGGGGTAVNLNTNFTVGTGNLNFASGSAPGSVLNLINGITVTGNINNTSTIPDTGTVNFAGNATVTGAIGTTLSLFAINLQGGAGTTVNLQSNATVSSGNINFTAGATTATLNLSDSVTINANIDNTSGSAGEGTLVFLGNGVVTGSIGAITHSLFAINLTGGAGTTVNLQGNVAVGSGNVNFAAGTAALSVLTLNSGVTVTGNIAANANNIGTLNLLGNSTITGTIGATNSLFAINLKGSGSTVNFQGSVNVGTGNLNFAANATLNLSNNVNVTGNIDNTTGGNNVGTLNFLGNSTISGTIGATNSLSAINLMGGGATTVNLQSNVTVGTGNLNFATGAAAGSTLSLSSGVTVTGNIDNTTGGNNIGTLKFLGSGTVTGTIGATNSLSAINLTGGGATTVSLQGNVTVGTGNVNFATGAAAGSTLSLSDGVTVTGNIDNTTGGNNIGTLKFLGSGTVTGAIGATNSLDAINLTGGGATTVNLQGNVTVGTGNLNFATGAAAGSLLSLSNGVTVTGNIDNTTGGGNIGTLKFLGSGTVTGTIGATNSLDAINLTGGGATTVNLQGNVTVGTGNLNFATGAAAGTTLSLSSGVTVTGNIDNTTGGNNIGTLKFLGSGTVTGTIGATNSLSAINLTGGGATTVNLQGNVTVGTGNVNFATGAAAGSTLSLSNGVTVTGNIDNTTGGGNIGTLNFLGSGTVTGTIGATNSLDAINLTGGGATTVNLQGNVTVGTGNLNFAPGAAAGTTLSLSNGVTVTGNIDNTTGGGNIGTLKFLGSGTVTGTIGATNSLDAINLTGGGATTVNLQGNVTVGTGNLNFATGAAAGSTLSLSNGVTVTGNIDNTTGGGNIGTLKFLGSGTVTGTIGATNSLDAINLTGGGATTVNLQGNVTVGTGNVNFATGAAAGSTLSLSNGVTVTGNIDNTTGGGNIGTLQFLGNGTVTGTIGATNSLSAINLTGGGATTVNLQSNVTVGTGNVNFATGAAAGSTLSLSNGVIVTGNIDNTTGGGNIGTLQFLGSGTVTGTIGATNSLDAINLTGGGATTVNLQGNVTVGTGNVNFATGSAAGSTLSLSSGVTVKANIDNTTGGNNIGTLKFLGNGTVTGTIGATNSLDAINITGGAGTTVNLQSNVTVGTGNINFATGSTATSNLNLSSGVIVTGNIDNTTGGGGVGTVQFQGGGQITGNIGASHSLNLITVNTSAAANQTLQLNGTTITVTTINVNDDHSGLSANGSTLLLHNTSGPLTLTANITATTNNEDLVNINGTQVATINGNIGTNAIAFNLIEVCQSANVNMNGNIFATTTEFMGDNTLTIGAGNTVSGAIATVAPNTGTLTLLGSFTNSGPVGTAINYLKAINLKGGAGTIVNFQSSITVGTGNLNFATGAAAGSLLSLSSGVTVTGNIDNTTGGGNIGTLQFLGSGTVTGTIGATNSLSAINLTGGGATTVNLQGNVTVGTGNLNFATGAVPGSTLSLSSGVTVTGNIDNTTGGNNIGTLKFLGNGTVTGTIGATNSLNAINITGGAGTTVSLKGNVTVGTGNLNFATGSAATSIVNFTDGILVTGNIDNTTGGSGIGTVQFQGGGQVTGTIGASNALNLITINTSGAVNKTLQLNGTTINATTINVNDDGSGLAGNGSTLLLNNTSGALILTGNITATTTNEDQVNINGTQASTINGNIGTVGTVFNLVKVAANASTLMNGNIYATTTQFQGNNTLTLASNSIVSGDITTTAPNQGILAFNGNFSSNGLIGTGVNYLNTINIQGGGGTAVNLNTNFTVGTGNLNFASGSAPGSVLNLINGITVTGNIDNTSTTPDTGTVNFAGNATVTGVIGTTLSLFAINLQGGAGTTVNLQSDATVSSGNINFTAGATTATLNLSDSVTINANIDNTSGSAGKGTLVFLGNGVVTGSIGVITNSLNAINLTGGAGTTVNLQGNIAVGGGNVNFAAGSTALSVLALNSGVTVTGNIAANANNIGTLNLLGNSTITGTIGAANSLFAINLKGAGSTVNFQSSVNVGTGNLNFAANATLNLSNNVNVTGNINNTTGGNNVGTLNFLGNSTISGTIGASNSLIGINLSGAGSVVNLQGSVNVGTNNLNFAVGATAATVLNLADGVNITGSITGSNTIGIVNFLGASTVTGTIGPIFELNQSGAGKTVNYDGNVSIGAGNFNFSGAANATTIANFVNGVVLSANVDNTTGVAGNGSVQFAGSAELTGNIGTTLAINSLTGNTLGAANQTLQLDGTTLNVNTILINDDGSGLAANGSTLLLNNTSGPLILTGNITATTNNEDLVNFNGSQSATVNGNIGTALVAFNLVEVGANADVTLNGNVYATNVQIEGNHNLILGSGVTVSGNIITTLPNQGTLVLLGNFTATGALGIAPNTLYAINIEGGAGTVVNFQNNVAVGNGDINFAIGSSPTTVLNLSDSVIITGSIDNTSGTADTGTLNFLGASTITSTIGQTQSLFAINLMGAGKTVNLQGNTTVSSGNLNFAANAILNLANNVNVTANIDNTTGANNIGTLNLLGNSTITGTIGATKSLFAINLKGAGSTVNLQGSINVGTGNLNFTTNAILNLANNVNVTGNINNTTGGDNVGTLNFLGNSTITGTIGASNSIFAINQSGASSIVNYQGNINVGTGNFNFSGAANSASTATFFDGIIITANIDNITGTAGNGSLQFNGGAKLTGNIGSSNALNLITANATGSIGKSLELDGAVINANTININDDGSGNPANGSSLVLNNTSQPLVLTANITATTNNEDSININGTQLATITGNIGTPSVMFNLVKVGANAPAIINGNDYATNTQFQGNNSLTFGNNSSSGNITTLNPNQGILIFSGNFSANGTIGNNPNKLNTITIHGPAGSVVNFDSHDVFASNVNIDNGGTLLITGNQSIDGALNLTNGSNLSLGNNSALTITNTLGAGTLDLTAGTMLTIDMGGNLTTTGTVTTKGLATVNANATLTINNPPFSPSGTVIIPLIISDAGGAQLHPMKINSPSLFTQFQTIVQGNHLNLAINFVPFSGNADRTNTRGVAAALEALDPNLVTGSLSAILQQIPNFTNNEDFNDALATLAPTVDQSQFEPFNIQRHVFDIIQNRLAQIYFNGRLGFAAEQGYANGDWNDTPCSSWISIFGQHAIQQERHEIPGYNEITKGFLLGYGSQLTDNLILGLAFSDALTKVDNRISIDSHTSIESYQLSTYGQYSLPCLPLFINWDIAIAYNNYDAQRNILFGDVRLSPKSNYHGWQYGGQGVIGYVFSENNFHTVPIASLYYSHLDLNSYTEMDAGTTDQMVDGSNHNALLTGLGVKITYDMDSYLSLLQPEMHFNVFYDFYGSAMQITSQFTGGGPSFVTAGAKPAQTSFDLGTGFVFISKKTGLLLQMTYDFNAKEQYTAHSGFMRLWYEWK